MEERVAEAAVAAATLEAELALQNSRLEAWMSGAGGGDDGKFVEQGTQSEWCARCFRVELRTAELGVGLLNEERGLWDDNHTLRPFRRHPTETKPVTRRGKFGNSEDCDDAVWTVAQDGAGQDGAAEEPAAMGAGARDGRRQCVAGHQVRPRVQRSLRPRAGSDRRV
jgi:hypothetical protein